MKEGKRAFVHGWLVASVLVTILFTNLPLPGQNSDYKIDSALMNNLTNTVEASAPFFVVFGDRADLKPAHWIKDRSARGKYVVQALEGVANRSQAQVRNLLRQRGVEFSPFWVENKIYVRQGTLELARDLVERPEVVAILPEVICQIPQPSAVTEAPSDGIEWNISKINAEQVWPITRGAGTVVANADTGVEYVHPALVNQYRGTTGPRTYSHTGNWLDPTNMCGGTPCDINGHGTHTMGTMVGDNGASNQIGVAPEAKWIACKGLNNQGSGKYSDLISCAQWFLDPFGTHDSEGHPDVVNNSWGGGGGNSVYESYIQSWRAAGIFPAFAAGNSGPSCSSVGSPGDNPEAFASGATDIDDLIANFSSRGPSKFGSIIKPNVSAPGVNIRSSWIGNTYRVISGTSMASPHTAGTVALIWAAAPDYRGKVAATELVINNTAMKLYSTQTCGGVLGTDSPNNTFGWGRIDAYAAVMAARESNPDQPATVSISSPSNGASFTCPATVGFAGTASDPEHGNLGSPISWSESGVVFGTGATASQTYDCTHAGNHNIVASVTDSAGATDTDKITIAIVPGTPHPVLLP
jgi:subtilisin family serine protease